MKKKPVRIWPFLGKALQVVVFGLLAVMLFSILFRVDNDNGQLSVHFDPNFGGPRSAHVAIPPPDGWENYDGPTWASVEEALGPCGEWGVEPLAGPVGQTRFKCASEIDAPE